jgi:hypothetical protein
MSAAKDLLLFPPPDRVILSEGRSPQSKDLRIAGEATTARTFPPHPSPNLPSSSCP